MKKKDCGISRNSIFLKRVAESVQSYEALAQTKEKNLTLEIEEEHFLCRESEKSIRQLTGILMDNASKVFFG